MTRIPHVVMGCDEPRRYVQTGIAVVNVSEDIYNKWVPVSFTTEETNWVSSVSNWVISFTLPDGLAYIVTDAYAASIPQEVEAVVRFMKNEEVL